MTVLLKGKDNAIVSGKLASLIGIDATGTNQKIRKACKELLIEGEAVVSCTKGFYIAENVQELKEYQSNIVNRIIGMERDVKAINHLIVEMEEPEELF